MKRKGKEKGKKEKEKGRKKKRTFFCIVPKSIGWVIMS